MPEGETSLLFVRDDTPGITRRRVRGKWRYTSPDGGPITDAEEIARLNGVGLPPAYGAAWFAPFANAHILATGLDARGRKRYRYHPDFRMEREARKFGNCRAFAARLPRIRKRVESDLRGSAITRERAIASIVRLLDTGCVRVGNDAYAKENNSFGATTLRMRHARVSGQSIRLSFRAKSGKQCTLRMTDRSLARFVKAMQDLPGQRLFQYLDTEGAPHPVTSSDVNAYIKETMGESFTAKDFRTWAASVLAFTTIYESKGALLLRDVLDAVSCHLSNTPAVARKSYIHPLILAAAEAPETIRGIRLPRATQWLSRHDRGLMIFLENPPT